MQLLLQEEWEDLVFQDQVKLILIMKLKLLKHSSIEVKEGDIITIDGSTGRIILGEVPTVKPEISGDFSKLMSWADSFRKLKVRTNSETPLGYKNCKRFWCRGYWSLQNRTYVF